MSWPVTNCSPISFMARCTPWRISGSPPLPITRVSADDRFFSLLVDVSLPVSTRPQAAAFTNSEGERPTWARQSPLLILSRISASRVARSGMRSKVLARVPVPGRLDRLCRRLDVGIVEDDHRRLAAELEVDALEVVGRRAG